MGSSFSMDDFQERKIFSVGDCPVCFDSGAVVLLKAHVSGRLFLFCPLCGLAWQTPPTHRVDSIDSIDSMANFAPDGATLPTSEEARTTGFALTEVAFEDWYRLLIAS